MSRTSGALGTDIAIMVGARVRITDVAKQNDKHDRSV
jgi:hypothetical protein